MPTLQEYISVASHVYGDNPAPSLTPFYDTNGNALAETNYNHGFHAAAFENDIGQIIIGFQGTSPKPTLFRDIQLSADVKIHNGENPAAFSDALAFTDKVLQQAADQGIDKSNVFLDGHSLGGAEAEYVSANRGLSGDTFGAPGISFNDFTTAANLTNFIDYGDPVGNFASNNLFLGQAAGNSFVYHAGSEVYVGDLNNSIGIQDLNREYQSGNSWHKFWKGVQIFKNLLESFHGMDHYASDTNI